MHQKNVRKLMLISIIMNKLFTILTKFYCYYDHYYYDQHFKYCLKITKVYERSGLFNTLV